MPERYNFVTENIDDLRKAKAVAMELNEFCINVHVHEFKLFGGKLYHDKYVDNGSVSYFITAQSIEEDSNAGCYRLRGCLEEAGISAVFINCPTEAGTINCKS